MKDNRKWTSIYIKPEYKKKWEKFKKYAKDNRYSYSELLLMLVEKFLKEVENEEN